MSIDLERDEIHRLIKNPKKSMDYEGEEVYRVRKQRSALIFNGKGSVDFENRS